MKRFASLALTLCILLSGCTRVPVVDRAETSETITAEATASATNDSSEYAESLEPNPEPEPQIILCDFEKEIVKDPKYLPFIMDINNYLDELDFQGGVLIAYNGRIILASGYGYRDIMTGERSDATDTYEVGSVSKQMTAAAILQLAEQGRLSLDDTIDKYFPEYEHGKNITIKNLLQMRSGLFDYLNVPGYFFPEDFVDEYISRADAADESTEDFPRDFLLEYLYTAPLLSAPDVEFQYCNTNFYLLGLIIEYVSGMSYQEYLQENIFTPCGMMTANNGFRETTTRSYYEDGTTLSMRTSTALGCGSVNAGVYDIYQWFMHLFGGDVIGEELLAEMLTPVEDYGYGMRCSEGLVYHTGNTDVYNAFAGVYYNGFMAVCLANQPKRVSNAGEVASEFFNIFMEHYGE